MLADEHADYPRVGSHSSRRPRAGIAAVSKRTRFDRCPSRSKAGVFTWRPFPAWASLDRQIL